MFKFTKKKIIAVISVIAVFAVGTAAFAYFTSTGSGTGQAAVGSSTHWTVALSASTGTMYPGSGSSVIPYTVTNAGTGNQYLTTTAASVNADTNGNVTSHGTSVSGCLATWFTATNTAPTAADLAGGAHTTGSVSVAMSDANANQNACEGVTPDVTVNAS